MKIQKGLSICVVSAIMLILCIFTPITAYSQLSRGKFITIYCGHEPGSTPDITARVLADVIRRQQGITVIVENRPGGGATLAAAHTATRKSDGYSVAILSSTALAVRPQILNVAYDPFKDFTYILAYSIFPAGICVKNDSPFKSIQELLEQARMKPGVITYSSTGIGSASQMAVEYLAKQAKVSFFHVGYKGGPSASTALLGGHVDFNAGAGIHLNYTKQGLFRTLAVTAAEGRHPQFPDVPILQEFGYTDVPPARYLLIAPKGLSGPVFKNLEDTFRQAAYSPEFQKVLSNQYLPFTFKDRRQLEAEFPTHYQFWGVLLKEFGVKQ
jgi:tripartite-type tricarboxylate transporter receptor subunit TctC